MFNHEPHNYKCPMCRLVKGGDDQPSKQSDIFYHDDFITALVSPKWWKNNPGSIIVIPNTHIENLYDMPDNLLSKVTSFAKRAASALKETYTCDGTSIRQHNEPAGNQDVWHFHIQVLPRYTDDNLYKLHDNFRWTKLEERTPYVNKLKEYF